MIASYVHVCVYVFDCLGFSSVGARPMIYSRPSVALSGPSIALLLFCSSGCRFFLSLAFIPSFLLKPYTRINFFFKGVCGIVTD